MKRVSPVELERLCAHLACLCQRLRGSGPTPRPAEAGARGTFCWPAAGRERPKRSSHFFTRFPRRLCSGRGCPIPLSPTASLSKIHLSPQSLPQTPVDSPGPDLKLGGRRETASPAVPPPASAPAPPPASPRAAAAATAATAPRRLPQTAELGKGVSAARARRANPGKGSGQGGEVEEGAGGRDAEEGLKGGEGRAGEGGDAAARGGEPSGRRRGLRGLAAGERRLPARLSQETAAGPPREGTSRSLPAPQGSDRGAGPSTPSARARHLPPARRSGMSEEARYPGR